MTPCDANCLVYRSQPHFSRRKHSFCHAAIADTRLLAPHSSRDCQVHKHIITSTDAPSSPTGSQPVRRQSTANLSSPASFRRRAHAFHASSCLLVATRLPFPNLNNNLVSPHRLLSGLCRSQSVLFTLCLFANDAWCSTWQILQKMTTRRLNVHANAPNSLWMGWACRSQVLKGLTGSRWSDI